MKRDLLPLTNNYNGSSSLRLAIEDFRKGIIEMSSIDAADGLFSLIFEDQRILLL